VLLFKKKYLPAIRSGEKTQTIRLWRHCRMRSGQRSYIPGADYIHVIAVDLIELSALSDEDALPDGFASAQALRSELTSLYADQLAGGHRAYRVSFRLLSPPEQVQAARERKQKRVKKAADHAVSGGDSDTLGTALATQG
jgi:hypothetical protein